MVRTLKPVEGVTDEMLDKMIALGIISLLDIEDVGVEVLVELCGADEATAVRVVETAAEEAKKILAEQAEAKVRAEAARKAREAQESEWARKLASGEMSSEQVAEARAKMQADEFERRAAEVGLGGGPPARIPISVPPPPVAAAGREGAGPLTLEQRLAMARMREQGITPGQSQEQGEATDGETPPEAGEASQAETGQAAAAESEEATAEPEASAEPAQEQEQVAAEVEQAPGEPGAESPPTERTDPA
jgi:hypothetical protein